MNIAISGAHCSGKTTLLNEMKNDIFFKNYNFHDSFSTKLVKVNSSHSENTTLNLQLQMLYNAANQANILKSYNTKNVFDRCVLDVLMYTCLSKENINNYLFQMACENILPLYDFIFVCGINGIALEDDNKRSLDKTYRDNVDFMFQTFIRGMDNIIYLNSPHNRLELIKYKIHKKINIKE